MRTEFHERRQLQGQADGVFRMGLCKRNTSHRRAKAVPEELFPDAAAAFVGDRFLDSLRSLEMTKRRLRLVEMTGEGNTVFFCNFVQNKTDYDT